MRYLLANYMSLTVFLDLTFSGKKSKSILWDEIPYTNCFSVSITVHVYQLTPKRYQWTFSIENIVTTNPLTIFRGEFYTS